MVQLFQPILHHALIYIDGILLFSGSHDDHRQLLTQLYDIIQSHGIMLSAKKSTIATDNIEFLDMIIKDGHCPRIASLSRSVTFQKTSSIVSRHYQLHP